MIKKVSNVINNPECRHELTETCVFKIKNSFFETDFVLKVKTLFDSNKFFFLEKKKKIKLQFIIFFVSTSNVPFLLSKRRVKSTENLGARQMSI